MAAPSREILFMGSVTALTMHEMQNVLAIIRESAGLMGDILRINASVPFKHRENMERSLEHIRCHVERGKGLLEATSRLAHSPDEDQLEKCDLAACLRAVAHLAERPARLTCSSVELTPCTGSVPVKVGALPVIMAGYQAVLCMIGPACRDGNCTVSMALEKGPQWHCVTLKCPEGLGTDAAAREALNRLMLDAGGRMSQSPGSMRLEFPAAA